jgi:hypothetical protein
MIKMDQNEMIRTFFRKFGIWNRFSIIS